MLGDRVEQVAVEHGDIEIGIAGILPSQRGRRWGNLRRIHHGIGKGVLQRQSEVARSGAQVEDDQWLDHRIDCQSEELFGLRAWDEAPPIDRYLDRPEWDPFFEILERLAGASPGNEGFEGRQFGIGDRYTQEQVGAGAVGGLGEETLGLVPREIADGGDQISGVSRVLAQFVLSWEVRSAQGGAETQSRLERARREPATCDSRLERRDSRLATTL